MGDTRGTGFQTPTDEHPPHERDDDFSVPEMMPDERRFKRLRGQAAGMGTKTRKPPTQR